MRVETLPALASFRSILVALVIFCLAWVASPIAASEKEQADQVAVGDTAPVVALEASDSTQQSSSELRGEKNLILIFFRGTW